MDTNILSQIERNMREAKENDWKLFISTFPSTIPPATLEYLKIIFMEGFARGTLFASTFMAQQMFPVQLGNLTGKGVKKDPINKMPDNLDDISRN